MTQQPKTIWLALTGEEGTPLAVFVDPESAFAYYGVETLLTGEAGIMAIFGAESDHRGATWAYPSLTPNEVASVFGSEFSEGSPILHKQRWMIYLWDPISETHERVILCEMPLLFSKVDK